MRARAGLVGGSLVLLGCAGAPAPTEGGAPRVPIAIRLAAQPGPALREDQIPAFSLDVVVRNTGSTTIDPRLGASILRVDGAPMKDWDVTINNGPRDGRWTALPPGDELHFTYGLGERLLHGPGEHVVVLESGGVASPPLSIRVTPR